jgi:DNA modification methylase
MEPSVPEYVNSIVETMTSVKRVLRRDGTLFLNLGDTYYSGKGKPHGRDSKHRARRMEPLRAVDAAGLGFPKKSLLGLPWRIATGMIDAGWTLRAPIIWQRDRPLPEANVLDRPWRTYEFVFLFTKSIHYRFNRLPLEAADEEDVWTINAKSVPGRTHPAAFPSELVGRCLDASGMRRGAVLDPFAGSCTVLKVAVSRGLSATGIELNTEYCATAASELSRLVGSRGKETISLRAGKAARSRD